MKENFRQRSLCLRFYLRVGQGEMFFLSSSPRIKIRFYLRERF